MSPPVDYRDHPEYYFTRDLAPENPEAMRAAPPSNRELIIGPVEETVPEFMRTFSGTLAFVSVGVDYYSSTKAVLRLFIGQPSCYRPTMPAFFDDVLHDGHNGWAGERLAISEFNASNSMRKIAPRIDQMFCLHVLDNPARSPEANKTSIARRM
ncbi:MAG TPA: hypothetical protein VHC40_10100 [Rhizomicrobium sp.]|nr:hypothetical protein [Rhizomicrobium sp.]